VSEIRAYLRHYREQRGLIILVTVLSLVAVGAEAVLLVVLVPLAASITGTSGSVPSLGPFKLQGRSTTELVVIALVAIVTSTVVQLVAVSLSARAAALWQHRWRHTVFQAFLDADWATQSRDRDGKLVAITGINIFQGAQGLTQITLGTGAIAGLLVMFGSAFVVAPGGALLMLVSGGLLFALLYPLTTFAKRRFKYMAAFNLHVSNELSQYASLAREIRLYGVADQVDADVGDVLHRHEQLRRRATVLVNLGGPLYRLGGIVLVLALIWFASTREAAAALGFGTAALLLYRSVGYGQTLQRSYQAVHETMPYLRSTDEEIALYEAHRHVSGAVELEAPHELEFRDVAYAYGSAESTDGAEAIEVVAARSRPDPASSGARAEVALHDVNVRLRRGEIVGVAGRSGAGKTTLAQLVLRLRRPTAGQVLIDGTSVDDFTDASWAREVSLVPQDTRLIHGTVAANIAFLREDLSREQIEQAAKDAGIHDAIVDLPDGYDTEVGPATRNLSGGQIQRVGIARALAGSPSILVLDEPTSALDTQSEQIIQDTLEGLRGRMLVVIIAHRLTTLSICDRVLIMDRGAIAAEGPPDRVLHDGSLLAAAADLIAPDNEPLGLGAP
jgi:ABC-type multidrug transport system fused ATPase/permease subunit